MNIESFEADKKTEDICYLKPMFFSVRIITFTAQMTATVKVHSSLGSETVLGSTLRRKLLLEVIQLLSCTFGDKLAELQLREKRQ